MGSSPIRVAIFVYSGGHCSSFKASVAQSVEQGTENPRVSDSIPLEGTILFIKLV